MKRTRKCGQQREDQPYRTLRNPEIYRRKYKSRRENLWLYLGHPRSDTHAGMKGASLMDKRRAKTIWNLDAIYRILSLYSRWTRTDPMCSCLGASRRSRLRHARGYQVACSRDPPSPYRTLLWSGQWRYHYWYDHKKYPRQCEDTITRLSESQTIITFSLSFCSNFGICHATALISLRLCRILCLLCIGLFSRNSSLNNFL